MTPQDSIQGSEEFRGYEGEVQDLKTSEPIKSIQFIAQMGLLAICSLTAWAFLDLWEAAVWFAAFSFMTAVEKWMIHRLPDSVSTAHFNCVRSILMVNAVIFGTMPVFLWFHDNEILKFGSLAIISGLLLNIFNTRARFTSILVCVLIPNALVLLTIGCGLVLSQGWTVEAVTASVVAVAIVVYFVVNLRDAHLKECHADEMRRQLQHTQKMEVLGQVTGGIAHDFNNVLSIINASLELLREQETDKERLSTIDQALVASENGASLTRQMLAFGQRAPLAPEVIDLETTLRTLHGMLRRVISSNIEIEVISDPGVSAIRVDPSLFQAALINLVLNASHAMPEGGKINMRACNYGSSKTVNSTKNGRVSLEITDTGNGISPEDLDRVFDPFFTTRQIGEGSGLGLSMVKGFVEQSGGEVFLTSELGRGTTVSLLFPAVDEAPVPSLRPQKTSRKDNKKGHILIVDDNEQLLELLSTKLRRDGHTVTALPDGDAASAALDGGLHPDLVLSDVVMRGRLQGTDIAELSRQLYPDMPIVLMSGYAEVGKSEGIDRVEFDMFLQKPVQLSELSSLVERLLSRAH